jgi:hypothetical protein
LRRDPGDERELAEQRDSGREMDDADRDGDLVQGATSKL